MGVCPRPGASVAISGEHVVVGAYGTDDGGGDSGSAYVFKTDGTFVTKLTASDAAGGDYFGAHTRTHTRLAHAPRPSAMPSACALAYLSHSSKRGLMKALALLP